MNGEARNCTTNKQLIKKEFAMHPHLGVTVRFRKLFFLTSHQVTQNEKVSAATDAANSYWLLSIIPFPLTVAAPLFRRRRSYVSGDEMIHA